MYRHGLCLKQGKKNYLYLDDTITYYQNLEALYQYVESKDNIEYLNFAYVTLCASTLEASLNHIIFFFYINRFGPIDYKIPAESLINIGFKNKLHTIPNIVTSSKFHINSESFTVKALEELITLRNRILHKKPLLQETMLDIANDFEVGMKMKFFSNNHIQLISKNQCKNFNKAILNFRNEFMVPFLENRLVSGDLLKE